MGIVNVTPDSFSDGGRFASADAAIAHGVELFSQGAAIVDVGGESTRPGISVDTSKPEVMRRALAAGAVIVNDVRALLEPGALDVVAQSTCGVVLMHMQGSPRTMQADPHYDNLLGEIGGFLRARFGALRAAGVGAERVLLDPGFGFGKTVEHNLRLLAQLRALDVPAPLVAGLSRKSTLGVVTGRGVRERIHASVAAALIAVQNGARVVRVHDVAATRDALAVWRQLEGEDR